MQLKADGNRIVDGHGNTVILRGANIVRYHWKYGHNRRNFDFDLTAVDVLTRRGSSGSAWNGVAATLWISAGPINRDDPDYFEYLDKCVEIAKNNGGVVIWSYADDEPNSGTHPYLISEAGIRAHAKLAHRYRNEGHVIHATQAEPGEWTNSRSKWRELRDVQERTVDAIRAEKPDVLIGVSGTSWSQRVDWLVDDPVRRDNLFAKPHVYASMPGGFDSNGVWAVHNAGWPVVIGEYGTGGRMNNSDSERLMELCEEHGFGYQAWNFADEGPPVLLNSRDTNNLTSYGRVVRDFMRNQGSGRPEEGSSGGGGNEPDPEPPEDVEPVAIPFRVNVGGDAVNYGGESWAADQPWGNGVAYGYVDGPGANGSAAHGENPVMETERWGLAGYRVRVPEGTYRVRCTFVETWNGIDGAGQRVFDVAVHDDDPVTVDPYAEGGSEGLQVVATVQVRADDVLRISFTPREELPMLKALEVLEVDADTEPPDSPDSPDSPDTPVDEELDQILDEELAETRQRMGQRLRDLMRGRR